MRIKIEKTALAIALSTVCGGAMAHGFVSLGRLRGTAEEHGLWQHTV
ncbi:hypothetical protein [Vibrio chagasii]|nr:hypothetical protein [Vibrio chagasii]MCG9568685.1 hypothetical protein [Vibrio chagasii]